MLALLAALAAIKTALLFCEDPIVQYNARMHRFFVPAEWIQAGQVTLRDPVAHQVQHVLRLHAREHIIVLDPEGMQYTAELAQFGPGEITARILDQQAAAGEPRIRLTLYQSLTQREKFEWILQKCTEVGICACVPVISSRSLVRAWDKEDDKKAQRWQRILQEAAEQSHRGRVPQLKPALRFEQAIAEAVKTHDMCLIPWEEEHGLSLGQALGVHSPPPASIALFIGPEGGFSSEEAQAAERAGIQAVTLGKRILRAETAAVVASALTLFILGEMG
jgi:16S rRNA (uracil1498-N3)-methyltransferase